MVKTAPRRAPLLMRVARFHPVTLQERRKLFLIGMAIPALAYVAAIGLWPLAQGLWYSFYDYNLLRPNSTEWVGLENYARVFADPTARQAMVNTLQFTLASVSIQFVLGMGLALLMWRDSSFNRACLAFLLIPATVTPLVVGLIFKALLGVDFGLAGHPLAASGLGPRTGLLNDLDTALWTLIAIDCWEWTPLVTLIMLAGLKSLPVDVLEAARTDGATSWQRFRLIVVPLMLPAIFLGLVLRTMDAFRIFDTVFVTTGGGPDNATNTLMLLAVKEGLQFFNIGYGAAIANISILFIAILMAILVLGVRGADRHVQGE